MAGKKLSVPKAINDKKPFKDERTKKRIHEHLTNAKDEISEEDISNVKTDVSGHEKNTPNKK